MYMERGRAYMHAAVSVSGGRTMNINYVRKEQRALGRGLRAEDNVGKCREAPTRHLHTKQSLELGPLILLE